MNKEQREDYNELIQDFLRTGMPLVDAKSAAKDIIND